MNSEVQISSIGNFDHKIGWVAYHILENNIYFKLYIHKLKPKRIIKTEEDDSDEKDSDCNSDNSDWNSNKKTRKGMFYGLLFIRLRERCTVLTEDNYTLCLQTLTHFDLCLIVESTITIIKSFFGESRLE